MFSREITANIVSIIIELEFRFSFPDVCDCVLLHFGNDLTKIHHILLPLLKTLSRLS